MPKNPCSNCAPFGGLFMETERGLRRCTCPAGQALKAADDARKAGPRHDVRPIISAANASLAVKALSAMPYFPAANETACTMVADAIMGMCTDVSQPMWLVRRMLNLYRRWPGVVEMRMVFAARFAPLDGIVPEGGSEIYPDGIPSEAKRPDPVMKALPPGEISADRALDNGVRLLAQAKSMDRPSRQSRREPQDWAKRAAGDL